MEDVAEVLGVSRFTVYNYLNALQQQDYRSPLAAAARRPRQSSAVWTCTDTRVAPWASDARRIVATVSTTSSSSPSMAVPKGPISTSRPAAVAASRAVSRGARARRG